jgi:uncharacterized membrane protein YhaH (DUF805 family)
MRTWPGILAAPVLVLADQAIAYALARWGCSYQHREALHWVHVLFLVAVLATIVPAWAAASRPALEAQRGAGDSRDRHHFLATVSVWLAALCALVIVAMWIPQWLLSPCYA